LIDYICCIYSLKLHKYLNLNIYFKTYYIMSTDLSKHGCFTGEYSSQGRSSRWPGVCISHISHIYFKNVIDYLFSIDDRVHTRELRSSADRTQLVIPRTRNKRASRTFSSAAPSTWNAPPSVPWLIRWDYLRRGWKRIASPSGSSLNRFYRTFPHNIILRPRTCIWMIIWDYVRAQMYSTKYRTTNTIC